MQADAGIQNVSTVAWNGTTSYPVDIRKFLRTSWSFEVKTVPLVNVQFAFESAPPSTSDNCVPGAFTPVNKIGSCDNDIGNAIVPETFTIPAGTPVGTICTGALPCRPDAFVRVVAVTGGASVFVVAIRQGPLV